MLHPLSSVVVEGAHFGVGTCDKFLVPGEDKSRQRKRSSNPLAVLYNAVDENIIQANTFKSRRTLVEVVYTAFSARRLLGCNVI